MKNSKILLSLLFSLLLVVAGCSANNGDGETNGEVSTGDEEVTIRYWQHSSPARDDMISSIVDDFMEENENITVELEFIPADDYNQKLITALGSGTAPDVFQIQSGMVPKFVDAESILPLDTEIMSKEYMEEEFIPATIEALQVDGEYYGVPTDTQTIITFWNKALYEEAGLDPEVGPETWDELFDRARMLTETDGDSMVQSGWGGKGYPPEVEAFISQNGGKFFDVDTQEFIFADDEKSMDAIKEMISLYRDDKVYDIDFEANWAGFRQGIVAQMLGHPAMIGNLKETAPDVDFGIGTIPVNGTNTETTITSWAYVMSKDADETAATKLINHLSSEDVQKTWTLETGELPARISLLEDADLLADPQTAVALESLENAVVGRLQTRPIYVLWGDATQEVMHTDRDIDEIFTELQDALNEEYGKQL